MLAESAPPCPAPAYKYDGENRLVDFQSGGALYSYDGTDLRVKKVSGSTTTVYIFSGTKVIAEYENGALPTNPTREYIYSGRQLLATIVGNTTTYHHADHLSVRLMTDGTVGSPTYGQTVGQRGLYPFGDSLVWYETGTTDKWKFTTYERDGESVNDYAIARYYINRFGRFASPDPLAGSVSNPQSLNRYAYVLNDPVDLIDPLGALSILWYSCVPVFGPAGECGWAQVGWLCWLAGVFEFPDLPGEGPDRGRDREPRGPKPPGLPTVTKAAYEKCARQAFGGTDGTIPGTDKSIPGFEAALAVFQESLFLGADAAVVGATMAIESNSDLNIPNSGTGDVGPMQLNIAYRSGNAYRVFGNAFGSNFQPGGTFNGDVRANIATGAGYLRDLGAHPQFYFSRTPELAAQRRQGLDALLPSMRRFFDCLTENISF